MRSFTIRIFGDQQLRRQLRGAAALAGNMKPSLNRIVDDMMRVIRISFMSQGRRGGGSWAALDPDTLKYKLNPLTLIETSDLMNAMTVRGHPSQILEVTKDAIYLDTDLLYSDVHQHGNDDIPARPFIRFIKSDRVRWVNVVQQDLKAAIVGR